MVEVTWKGRHKMLTKSINCVHANNVLMEESQTQLFEKQLKFSQNMAQFITCLVKTMNLAFVTTTQTTTITTQCKFIKTITLSMINNLIAKNLYYRNILKCTVNYNLKFLNENFYVKFLQLSIKRINCLFKIFPNLSCLWIYC